MVADAERAARESPKAGDVPSATVKSTPIAAAEPAKSAASRSERERIANEEAARKALAAAGKASKAATVVASSAPPVAAATQSEFETLYQQALAMEQGGKPADAIRIYRRAARAGSGKAAKRLGEIYDKGIAGVSRDYAESLQWYETARGLGETVESAARR